MKKLLHLIHFLKPPQGWKLPVTILLGISVGLFVFLFYVSNAYSYLSDNPKTCVNCHIMTPQYATWFHSSHREYATCNDCHVPHNNIVNSYYFKAKDGLRHATVFTMRAEPQAIIIKDEGHKVVHQNCIRCHNHLIDDPKMNTIHAGFYNERTDRTCWECHKEVPHGKVRSLSSTPHAFVPLPESPVPQWLKKIMND